MQKVCIFFASLYNLKMQKSCIFLHQMQSSLHLFALNAILFAFFCISLHLMQTLSLPMQQNAKKCKNEGIRLHSHAKKCNRPIFPARTKKNYLLHLGRIGGMVGVGEPHCAILKRLDGSEKGGGGF